jgi:predicted esterase YcpF (UPF0227 family)
MTPLNILYVHGFGSRVDPTSDKRVALATIADVEAVAPDYSRPFDEVLATVQPYLAKADLLLGTSMGGFLVSRLSASTGKPFVAINPVLNTATTLSKYLGTHQDHVGRTFTLSKETVNTYPDFLPSPTQGMVLLDLADELLDSQVTQAALQSVMKVHAFPGGSHRFSHMVEALPLIQQFVKQVRKAL